MSFPFITGILAGFTALASVFVLCNICYRMGYNDARQTLLKGQHMAINEVNRFIADDYCFVTYPDKFETNNFRRPFWRTSNPNFKV